MNVKYFVVKGKKKYLSIYVRFWDSKRIDQKTRTGIHVIYDDWSEKKQRIKVRSNNNNADFYNSKLRDLEGFVVNKYNLHRIDNRMTSKAWLKDTVAEFFGKIDENEEYKAYLVPWAEKFVKEAPTRLFRGKSIKSRSVKNYQGALNKLRDFEAHQKKRFRFDDIDLVFHKEFINYLRKVDNLNDNSIGNIISRVKTFCREIEFEGYTVNPQYKSSNFNLPKNETFNTYLNDVEIDKIFNHDFGNSERLDNARDLFIIGLRTGLRISDFLSIKDENILGNVINITTTKGNQNLTIPIHPQFQKILNKREGMLPREISNKSFNIYIKEVCSEAGINDLTFGKSTEEGEKKPTLGYFQNIN